MRSLDVLTAEHVLLKTLFETLEAAIDRLAAGNEVPADVLQSIMTDLSFHLEQVHMAKEEHVLFPYLESHGLPRSIAVVNALATQHQLVRVHADGLRALCGRMTQAQPPSRQEVVVAGREFIELFRDHARIEEEYFYGLADRVVPDDDDSDLSARFEAIDRVTQAPEHRDATRDWLSKHRPKLGLP